MKYSPIVRIMPLVLAALLTVSGCARPAEPSDTTADHERPDIEPCHQAFTPEPITLDTDQTDYRTMAEAVFDVVAAAPASDFTYEMTDGGVRLTAYNGTGGTVVIPDSIQGTPVTALGDGLFQDNTALTALSIPTSVTSIGVNLLTGCRSLQLLRLPQLGAQRDGLGFLSYFFGCQTPVGTGFRVPSSLDTVILWDTVTEIPQEAFLECSKLRMVILPDTLERIGQYAFSDCSQLHFVPLPASLQSLEKSAFANCTDLRAVTLPDSLQSMGPGVYEGCSRLQQLTLPFLGENRNADGYIGYLFGAESYMWNATHVPRQLLSVTLTSGDVADHAFYGCDRLAMITLPENCTFIGIRAFYGCSSLQEISIPDGTTTVDELAFVGCRTLAKVSLPDSLQNIGMQAFMDCSNLTEITLPASMTALAPSTFAGCCNLQAITLGANLSALGAQAFRGCVALRQVSGGASDMTVEDGNEYLTYCFE